MDERELRVKIFRAILAVMQELKSITPIDTGALLSSIQLKIVNPNYYILSIGDVNAFYLGKLDQNELTDFGNVNKHRNFFSQFVKMLPAKLAAMTGGTLL